MAKFTKNNNPSKRRTHKRYSRTEADIIASKRAFDDKMRGVELPASFYDHISDDLSGNPSRNIYGTCK
jgi:hypothetical protein